MFPDIEKRGKDRIVLCVCVCVCTMQYLDALTLENYSLSEIQIELGALHFIWQPHLHRCQN